MKKHYSRPVAEFVVFTKDEIVADGSTPCSNCATYCPDAECDVCDYLVCEPRDVII